MYSCVQEPLRKLFTCDVFSLGISFFYILRREADYDKDVAQRLRNHSNSKKSMRANQKDHITSLEYCFKIYVAGPDRVYPLFQTLHITNFPSNRSHNNGTWTSSCCRTNRLLNSSNCIACTWFTACEQKRYWHWNWSLRWSLLADFRKRLFRCVRN